MKIKLTFLFLLFAALSVKAQDFTYASNSSQELDMKTYDKDPGAHALVLQEFGEARINTDNDNNVRLFYYYHVKIKILDSKGLDKGNVEIPFYEGDNNAFEEVYDIKGVTFNNDNGALTSAELNSKNTYSTKQDKHWHTIKFAMPGMKVGSVIEYSYHIISPYYLENFRSWEFQTDIPKISSQYLVHIPAFFNYKATLRGYLKLSNNESEVEKECFSLRGAKNDCSKIVYGMKNIPAFVEEDYMTAPKNFKSALNFELEEYVNPYTYTKVKVTREWKDIDDQLRINEDFGGQIRKKGLFKDKLTGVISAGQSDLEKARAVYAFIQKSYKWDNYIGIYSVDGLKTAFNAHSGSIADINLSLVVALNDAGVPTEAVTLSTRNHGTINMLYPVLGDFDYVIAKANIGDKSYLLDASDPLLAFGLLPMKCLNDKGRVFSPGKASYWIDMDKTPQRESDSFNFDLTLQEDGKIKGTLVHYSLGYSAYMNRKAMKKFNSLNEYVENLDERLHAIKILKSDITGLDSLNSPLTEKYEIELETHDGFNGNQLSFDPYFFDRTTVNPFKLPDRDYPVDWGMPSDRRYSVTLHLPQNYTLGDEPKSQSIALPNGGGKFITSFQTVGDSFNFTYVTQFSKSIYNQSEYPYLKELYNRIIAIEKENIVLKKKI